MVLQNSNTLQLARECLSWIFQQFTNAYIALHVCLKRDKRLRLLLAMYMSVRTYFLNKIVR